MLTGCTITDPSTDLAVRITMPASGAVIGGQIKDSFGRMVSSEVTLTLSGPDAGHIVDLMNERVTTLTTTSGFVVMAVNDTIPVSAEDPVVFTLTASADGYFTASKQITVDRTEGISFQLRLLSQDIASLPDGLEGDQEETSTDGSGATTAPVTLSPPPNETSGTTASVEIPAGTRFLDGNGNPIIGNVTLQVTLGDLRSDTLGRADEYTPGGRDNTNVTDSTVISPISFFILSGQDASGNQVAGFDPFPGVTMQIPGGTFNPNTGANYVAGDAVFLYNRNGTGNLVPFDRTSLTGPNGSGNFTAKFTAAGVSAVRGKSGNPVVDDYDDQEVFVFFGGDEYYPPDPRTIVVIWDHPTDDNARMEILVEVSGGNLDPIRQQKSEFVGVWQGQRGIGHEAVIFDATRTSEENPALTVRITPIGGEPFDVTYPADAHILDLAPRPWPGDTKSVTYHIYAKMPEGRDPSEVRTSGLYVQIADAADTSSWRAAGSVQRGEITISDLIVGHSYWLKGTYTFRGQTRTANTPWTRQITTETDTLQYWYQLSDDEADEYENG